MNFANAGQSTLLNAIAAGDLSLTVVDGTPFPAAPFHIVIDTELMLVTNSVSGTFTVTRAIEGTTAAAHIKGAVVTNCVTAADLAAFLTTAVTSFNTRTGAVTLTSTDVFGVLAAGTNITLTNSGGVVTIASTGGGGGGDAVANLVNAINALTNPAGTTLTVNAWNAITATAVCNAKLPVPTAGHAIGVYITQASTNMFTLNPNSTEKIQPGNNSSRVMWQGESAILISNGTDWIKTAGLTIPMRVVMSSPSNQSIAVGTPTRINITASADDNTGLMADTTNKRIVIQRAGDYSVMAGIGASPNGAGDVSGSCNYYIYKNSTTGTLLSTDGPILSPFVGNNAYFGAAKLVYGLVSGDTIDPFCNCTTNCTLVGVALPRQATILAATEIPSW